ncbi:F-box protein At1g10110-like [Aegilops tauschii subsp. strangulata]|uniref:F-box protein At1g10110-like n=1 Tax=Aegilops tauschii subsp. strangulata TaxID=200361 RepID=UPI00098A7114|nr:putative F-box protein At2g33200 [Aegilops tauschii subsp. strangulata]
MEAVTLSAVSIGATNDKEAQRRSIAPTDAPDAADWSGLLQDLLLAIMAALDVPSLVRSGAVCTSWRDAYSTFRLPALKQAPCLLYACDEYGPKEAALYCPSTNATFRVPFPGPPLEKRGFVFSCHGWVFAADEVGDPYLFNPITGVQAALPPVKTLSGRDEDFYDDEGKHVIDPGSDDENEDQKTSILWARDSEYIRVAISSAAEVTACTVLIMHNPDSMLSFAKPGDKRWTLLPNLQTRQTGGVSDVLYNDKDGLF